MQYKAKFGNKLKCLVLKKKTGFRNVSGGPVVILDDQYEPFYDTRILDNKVWEFNLPKGTYYVQAGKFRETPNPVEYRLDTLPPRERKLQNDPESFPIVYGDNQFTGTVYWDPERSPYGKCVILFDRSLMQWPLPDQAFIYYHECAHRYYDRNEAACDAWAKNRMLEEGYNPSQIGAAIIRTLSEKNARRKERMIDTLIGM